MSILYVHRRTGERYEVSTRRDGVTYLKPWVGNAAAPKRKVRTANLSKSYATISREQAWQRPSAPFPARPSEAMARIERDVERSVPKPTDLKKQTDAYMARLQADKRAFREWEEAQQALMRKQLSVHTSSGGTTGARPPTPDAGAESVPSAAPAPPEDNPEPRQAVQDAQRDAFETLPRPRHATPGTLLPGWQTVPPPDPFIRPWMVVALVLGAIAMAVYLAVVL